MRAATEGSLPPVMPQGNLVEALGQEVRQGSPGELMVESSPSRQRRPPCKTNKEMSDEAADAAPLTYLLTMKTHFSTPRHCCFKGSTPPSTMAIPSQQHPSRHCASHFLSVHFFRLTLSILLMDPPVVQAIR